MKQHFKNKIKAIGLMSGTSLDGLDLVTAEFEQNNGKWNFTVHFSETISYSHEWLEKLRNSPALSGEKLMELHSEFGRFLGIETNRFIKATDFTPDLIASHGHTVFHQPEKHFTFQLGNGADIAAITQITTVTDFRTGDVALGGQGAPLVPVGDRLLFSDFENCLNLGGFANISFEKNGKRIAFDICPVNIVLNYFAEKQGFTYDKDGDLGRKGKLNTELHEKLNQLDFYRKEPPKSLGREWVEQIFLPVLNGFEIADEDKLRTIYEHIAEQIAGIVSGRGEEKGKGGGEEIGRGGGEEIGRGGGKMLVTGGGTFNTFLIELISNQVSVEIVIPSNEIINFKEALIFAFLGVLKNRDEINCYASVTGATRDHSSGIVFHP